MIKTHLRDLQLKDICKLQCPADALLNFKALLQGKVYGNARESVYGKEGSERLRCKPLYPYIPVQALKFRLI